MIPTLLAAAALGILSPDPLSPLFLTPAAWTVPGPDAAFGTRRGDADAPIDPASIDWAYIRVAGTQRNYAPGELADPLTMRAESTGLAIAGISPAPRIITVPSDTLRAAIADAMPDDPPPRALPAKTARLRIHECAKTILHVGDPGPADNQTANSKAGQRSELRPLINPLRTPPGSDFAVRVFLDDTPRAGIRVRVSRPAADPFTVETGPSGFANITIPADAPPGDWLLETRWFTLLDADPDADAAMFVATLTFRTDPPPPADTEARP